MFISHYHHPEDGFPNLEEGTAWIMDDQASESSVVRRSVAGASSIQPVLLHNVRHRPRSLVPSSSCTKEIKTLADLSREAGISIEVKRYLHNILTFLRLHRAVGGGVSPRATQHFDLLVKCVFKAVVSTSHTKCDLDASLLFTVSII